jgi:tRNA (guanine-N7-)-methyltransferase
MTLSRTLRPLPDEETVMLPAALLLRRLDLAALFGNANPVELDLGCGTGHFLIRRAEKAPGTNLLGIERLLGRARTVAGKALRRGLTNVRVLRVEAAYAVQHMLPADAIATVYIFFPDPWPKRRHHARRLIGPAFLTALRGILIPGGVVHVATDDADYGCAIARTFAAHSGFREVAHWQPEPDEQTSFERLWLREGRTILRRAYARCDAAAMAPISTP